MITIAQTPVTGVTNGRPSISTNEMEKISISAVFQARSTAITADALKQMERRDRVVLILLDGQRTIADVMHLLHRSEGEVARVLIRLLKSGHIEYMGIRRK